MKRLTFLILLIALSISIFAQRPDRFRNDFYVGLSGGMHASQVDFRPLILQTYRIGVNGGIAAKFISSQNESGNILAGIIGELNFSQRGWTEEFDYERFPDFAYSRALNYIDLPFMTHVNVGRGNVRFIFNAGPQISFLLSDNATMSRALADHIAGSDRPSHLWARYDSFEHLKRFDYGIIGGMGLQIRTPIGHFDLEGRYFFGLGDVLESRRGRNAVFSRSAHRVIPIRLTYYVRIN